MENGRKKNTHIDIYFFKKFGCEDAERLFNERGKRWASIQDLREDAKVLFDGNFREYFGEENIDDGDKDKLRGEYVFEFIDKYRRLSGV